MNIAVVDVAADKGGAASILEYYYRQHAQDKDNHYTYFLSTYHLDETDNISVVSIPWIKQSWLMRLSFDLLRANSYMKKYGIDEIISLQNIVVPGFKGRQTVYEHNALPFSEHRYSLREDRMMWIYQNVIGRLMLQSIKKADRVIVQTEWMKAAILHRVPGIDAKIEVQFPVVDIPGGMRYAPGNKKVFFYPANESVFKNHELIIQACEKLQADGIGDFTVVFTLRGDENDRISSLRAKAMERRLNIRWIGVISREKVFEYYQKSILVFPSYIETVGLPIYEAKQLGCPVLLADLPYARDVAGQYENARYFNYRDWNTLAELMKQYID